VVDLENPSCTQVLEAVAFDVSVFASAPDSAAGQAGAGKCGGLETRGDDVNAGGGNFLRKFDCTRDAAQCHFSHNSLAHQYANTSETSVPTGC
jgi:hypothetical protein